jgi:uncharacterized protein
MKEMIFVMMFAWATPSIIWAGYEEATEAFDRGDTMKALQEFQTLADRNDPRGQYGLGIMYDLGEGVSRNFKYAAKLYRLSAEQGYADAQNNLGVMYENGEGVPVNHDEAMKWYRKAAKMGNKDAPNNIGTMYMTGIGIPRDFVKAYMWFTIAGKRDLEAVTNKKFLLKKITSKELAQAQSLAQEWLMEKD